MTLPHPLWMRIMPRFSSRLDIPILPQESLHHCPLLPPPFPHHGAPVHLPHSFPVTLPHPLWTRTMLRSRTIMDIPIPLNCMQSLLLCLLLPPPFPHHSAPVLLPHSFPVTLPHPLWTRTMLRSRTRLDIPIPLKCMQLSLLYLLLPPPFHHLPGTPVHLPHTLPVILPHPLWMPWSSRTLSTLQIK